MREIKFRAWSNEERQYVYSDTFAKASGKRFGLTDFFKFTDISILEQYTGRKDKNGKKLYEGDILRDYDEGYLYQVVYYKDDTAFKYYDFINGDYYWYVDLPIFEIIGNIHETPELLND
jgi:uncharacterized phage protein (TIGR01671 family)